MSAVPVMCTGCGGNGNCHQCLVLQSSICYTVDIWFVFLSPQDQHWINYFRKQRIENHQSKIGRYNLCNCQENILGIDWSNKSSTAWLRCQPSEWILNLLVCTTESRSGGCCWFSFLFLWSGEAQHYTEGLSPWLISSERSCQSVSQIKWIG